MATNFFNWDPAKYSVKINQIDNEHQKLISLMNTLYVKNEAKASKSEILTAMKDLGSYTEKHFSNEEAFFSKLPYSQAEGHKKIHKDLLTKFNGHLDNFQKSGTLSVDFFNFLKVWLSAHIVGVDTKYAEIANSTKKAG
jgi:hemerythrin-like metal-binding protein